MNASKASTHPPESPQGVAWKLLLAALVGIGLILWLDDCFVQGSSLPKLSRDMSHGLLLLVGFLTSFHCVGMCGPLIVGYTAKHAASGVRSYVSHLLYGVGKTLSYTVIGGLFGAFGSVIAFTPFAQGMVGVAAGLFLLLFGLHMLNVIPALRHFQIKTPAFLLRFVGKEVHKHHNPFAIGLLNGLMIICGPLQAMYVMAAGTGSWSEGATLLFFFGLGALPLMLGFGFLASLLSASLTPKLLKASGVIVMVLGAVMLNRGLAVTGLGLDLNTLVVRASALVFPKQADDNSAAEQTIVMDVSQDGFSPNQFTLRKGVPVNWVINGKELNECNRGIIVPKYDIKISVQPGTQTVHFIPKETGVVSWSCSMGMIPGSFNIVDDAPPQSQPAKLLESARGSLEAAWRGLVGWVGQWQRWLESQIGAGVR